MLRIVVSSVQAGRAQGLAESRFDLRVGKRNAEGEHVGRPAQPPHVPFEQKRLAVVGPKRLVNTFAVEEALIEHGDDGVFLVRDAAVDVHRGWHREQA